MPPSAVTGRQLVSHAFRTLLLLSWAGLALAVFSLAVYKGTELLPQAGDGLGYLLSGGEDFRGEPLTGSSVEWEIRSGMEEESFVILVLAGALFASACALLGVLFGWLPDRIAAFRAREDGSLQRERFPALRTWFPRLTLAIALVSLLLATAVGVQHDAWNEFAPTGAELEPEERREKVLALRAELEALREQDENEYYRHRTLQDAEERIAPTVVFTSVASLLALLALFFGWFPDRRAATAAKLSEGTGG